MTPYMLEDEAIERGIQGDDDALMFALAFCNPAKYSAAYLEVRRMKLVVQTNEVIPTARNAGGAR